MKDNISLILPPKNYKQVLLWSEKENILVWHLNIPLHTEEIIGSKRLGNDIREFYGIIEYSFMCIYHKIAVCLLISMCQRYSTRRAKVIGNSDMNEALNLVTCHAEVMTCVSLNTELALLYFFGSCTEKNKTLVFEASKAYTSGF